MTEYHQKTKIAMILCSCFFAFGSYWSDWAFDYYLLWANPAEHPTAVSRAALYYTTQSEVPNILKYIPLVNLLIAAAGFSAGLANMTDGNMLFDGASIVLLLFGISTYASSVKPALVVITESKDDAEVLASLKNIAAAHFIIVLAVTGIVGLQLAHLFVMKKTEKSERLEKAQEPVDASASNKKKD
ncbi:ER membrane protein SH3 [Halteromyces radiatus]|uniref:ER membrane protein SH3 n=1 Tax=Halteromyces radiatus TaxID=101107 RepID=UPI00221FD2BA|nr:ER membrane protein SH3 [Halteromyces radiatus]KAI8081544.1 ER membrane protein SH3 [Halteromyces radiatus]